MCPRAPRSYRRGERTRIGLGLVAAAAVALALSPAAEAATETFEYTGAAQTWTVPEGVTTATFDVYGAAGGGTGSAGAPAQGGRAEAAFSVTPGTVYQVNVGEAGSCCDQTIATFGGGAPGGSVNVGIGIANGGSGGGASDVRFGGDGLSDRLLVAGGGGGISLCQSGFGSGVVPHGGAGGGLIGGDPTSPCPGGSGGTQSAGGNAAGTATAGSFGLGGAGAQAGGGGGGGWYGGGGGTGGVFDWGGGGGGSGHGPPGTTFETGVRSGNGLVTITYAEPPPDYAPRIDALSIDPKSFPTDPAQTPLTRKMAASISITLSEDATVTFRIRRNPPRMDGGPPPRKPRSFTRELLGGESDVPFTGTLGGRTFKPGRYKLLARAYDEMDQRSEKASATFRITSG